MDVAGNTALPRVSRCSLYKVFVVNLCCFVDRQMHQPRKIRFTLSLSCLPKSQDVVCHINHACYYDGW